MRARVETPPAPRSRRTLLLSSGKRLVCPHGHHLKGHPMLMAWDGYTCGFLRPPNGPVCGASAFYVRGTLGAVWVVECTKEELAFIRDHGMSADMALAWLGVGYPNECFTPLFHGCKVVP